MTLNNPGSASQHKDSLDSYSAEDGAYLIDAIDSSRDGVSGRALSSLEQALKRGFNSETEKAYRTLLPESEGFYVEDAGVVWRFYNTGFELGNWVEELTKDPVVKSYCTQEQAIPVLRENALQLPSAPRLYNILKMMYKNRNSALQSQRDVVEKVRSGLSNLMWLLTGTALNYSSDGSCRVLHCWNGSLDSLELGESANLVGPNGWVNELSGFEEAIYSIFKERDLCEFRKVFNWFSGGFDPYLWRAHRKPGFASKQAVVIGRDDGKNIFNIGANYIVKGCALGWSARLSIDL
ncbi:hypothetical protein D6825_02715 [Candidatus Woesearchaeota archaeon]|nr:MAG: hypothetical protein D6825_02715 [Candidatus Woesearchaeota archaeon]